MLLMIDNYDSFTYNLAQILEESALCDFDVIKNDEIKLLQVENYDKILLSPGPDVPSQTKMINQIIAEFYDKKPIFGVCLGMQAIAEFFGAKLFNMHQVFHGIKEKITITEKSKIFNGLGNRQEVGLYHSWAVSEKDFPKDLRITAKSEQNIIMAIEHKNYPVFGVQFHPESYMTKNGKIIINNWINI